MIVLIASWDSAAKIIIREIKRLEGSNDMDGKSPASFCTKLNKQPPRSCEPT